MSIGDNDRVKVAEAIEAYLRCEIDNFELDDVLFAVEDRAAFEIASQVWFFYDDCKRHKNEGKHKHNEAAEALLRRWVMFLRSDHPWPIDEPDNRTRWYSAGRWRGMWKPIGCLLELVVLPIMLPIGLFQAIVLGHPRPRFAKNEYWPFQSVEEWTELASKD